MQQALREAEAALAEDEVPIGVVVVYEDPTDGSRSSDVAIENNHSGVLVRVRLTATGDGQRISRQSTSSANESHFRTP